MSEQYLAEIKIVSFNFAPKGWALCNGQLLPINQNQALFSLLGTTYGGNGQTTFALPDFRGRTPIHFGAGYNQGQSGGAENHALTFNQMPAHTHSFIGTTADADRKEPAASSFAYASLESYAISKAVVPLHSQAVTNNGGGNQVHLNMQPFLTFNFIIALQGIFPSPN